MGTHPLLIYLFFDKYINGVRVQYENQIIKVSVIRYLGSQIHKNNKQPKRLFGPLKTSF